MSAQGSVFFCYLVNIITGTVNLVGHRPGYVLRGGINSPSLNLLQ